MSSYDDMLYLPRPVSAQHPPMPRAARAAQFAAFDALSGYGALVAETARSTQPGRELTDQALAALDEALRQLTLRLHEQPRIRALRFLPDARKPGGSYHELRGRVCALDRSGRTLRLTDGTRLPLDELVELELD